MARFIPRDISSAYDAQTALNANFADIAELFEETLFRDGRAFNALTDDLDVNHYKLKNVNPGVADSDGVNLSQVVDLVNTIPRGPAGPDTQEVLTNLQGSGGGSMVGLLDGTSLQQSILTTPRSLSYGKRAGVMTLRQARDAAESIHTKIVGYAAFAGTTGGFGLTEYLVTIDGMDATMGGSYLDPAIGGAGTYAWCKAQAIANGGGKIIFYPTGSFNPIIRDSTQNRFSVAENNITVIAPGLNATLWHTSLDGSTVVKNQNLILANLEFRTLPGPMSGDFDGSGEKTEKILVNVDPSNMNKVAIVGCTFNRASDGALDIAGTAFTGASPAAYFTVQDCVFRNTDECSLIGSISDTSLVTDVRKLFGTFYNCVYDGCGQRLPKVLGNAFVDMVNCYSQIVPWRRDQPAPVAEYGTCYGAGVQNGGHLHVRGCLWTVLDDVTGREATRFVVPSGDLRDPGAIKVEDSAAEYGMTFATGNEGLIGAIPYTLAHTPVPVAGATRETWIADRWKAAGAGNDSAPPGLFLWDQTSTEYPDQTYIVRRRGVNGTFLSGREIRVDSRAEVLMDPGDEEAIVKTEGRGYTRTIGFTEGKTSLPALGGASTLDLANQDSGFFSVVGNGGPANLKFVQYTDGNIPLDGQELTIVGGVSAPVTVKSATSVVVTGVETTIANALTIPAHGMATGDFPISLTNSGGELPAGIVSGKKYYAAVIDADNLKLADTYAQAISGAAGDVVQITSAGTGTHTALIGSFNLPGGFDVKLDSSTKILKFRLYTGASDRFTPQSGTFNTSSGEPTGVVVAGLINVSNVTLTKCKWFRVDNEVVVRAVVSITPTEAGADTQISLTLPVASDLTNAADLAGTGAANTPSTTSKGAGPIFGGPGSEIANYRFISLGTTALSHYLMFTYTVK